MAKGDDRARRLAENAPRGFKFEDEEIWADPATWRDIISIFAERLDAVEQSFTSDNDKFFGK